MDTVATNLNAVHAQHARDGHGIGTRGISTPTTLVIVTTMVVVITMDTVTRIMPRIPHATVGATDCTYPTLCIPVSIPASRNLARWKFTKSPQVSPRRSRLPQPVNRHRSLHLPPVSRLQCRRCSHLASHLWYLLCSLFLRRRCGLLANRRVSPRAPLLSLRLNHP